MRIGINTRFLVKDNLEGVGWYTYEICRRIVKNHPNIEFFFYFDRPYDEEFIFEKNVHPIVIGPPARHPFLWYVWFERSLKSALEEHKIDVLFSPDSYMSLSTHVPTMITCHDLAYLHYPKQIPFLVRKYYTSYFPKFFHKAAKITAVSKSTKSDLMAKFKIKSDKIIIAHNSCRENFKPIGSKKKKETRTKFSEGKPYFVYLGSVHPRKNLPNLIQAFDLFKEETGLEYKLLIIGRKAWKSNKFDKALSQSPNKDDILIYENIVNDVFELVASATAMVYVSYFEGFGLPILEAMSCGTPVICSKTSSMPEVAGKAALLVNPKKAKTIASAMQKLVNDDDLRKHLIKEGFKQTKKFSWDKSAKLIGDALINLADQA